MAASTVAQPVADRYMTEVLDLLEQHGLDLPGNWPTLSREARQAAQRSRTLADVHGVVHDLLTKLDDGHSSFLTPDAAQKLWQSDEPKAQKRPKGHLLGTDIAYLELPSFSSLNEERINSFAREVRNEMDPIVPQASCGFIVDLRGNTGGNMWPMLAGIAPLLRRGVIGSFVSPSETLWWRLDEHKIYTEASTPDSSNPVPTSDRIVVQGGSAPEISALHSAPDYGVAVLIGPRTASSGEAVAIALLARESARTFGGRSAGLTTSNRAFELSDGALLNLRVSRMGNADGVAIEGPLVPNEPVRHRSSRRAGHDGNDPVLASGLLWLRTACQARATQETLEPRGPAENPRGTERGDLRFLVRTGDGSGRVAPGSYPPGAPTDPDVRD